MGSIIPYIMENQMFETTNQIRNNKKTGYPVVLKVTSYLGCTPWKTLGPSNLGPMRHEGPKSLLQVLLLLLREAYGMAMGQVF